ncbi:hypothetical protein MHYP_G00114130 [Metynnis hypsauchen]
MAAVLGGPVGQAVPDSPDALIEPFISCQPGAGHQLPAASRGDGPARQPQLSPWTRDRAGGAVLQPLLLVHNLVPGESGEVTKQTGVFDTGGISLGL